MILMGDFNVEPTEKHVKDFSLIYNFKNIIKGVLSGLRQFLATESALKMMKNAFKP